MASRCMKTLNILSHQGNVLLRFCLTQVRSPDLQKTVNAGDDEGQKGFLHTASRSVTSNRYRHQCGNSSQTVNRIIIGSN